MHTVIRPSPLNPVACPGGDVGSGVLITALSLFDPTGSTAVRPPGAASCTLMVMADGPGVTADMQRPWETISM